MRHPLSTLVSTLQTRRRRRKKEKKLLFFHRQQQRPPAVSQKKITEIIVQFLFISMLMSDYKRSPWWCRWGEGGFLLVRVAKPTGHGMQRIVLLDNVVLLLLDVETTFIIQVEICAQVHLPWTEFTSNVRRITPIFCTLHLKWIFSLLEWDYFVTTLLVFETLFQRRRSLNRVCSCLRWCARAIKTGSVGKALMVQLLNFNFFSNKTASFQSKKSSIKNYFS